MVVVVVVAAGFVVFTAMAYFADGPLDGVGLPVKKVHKPRLCTALVAVTEAGSAEAA